MIVVLEDLSQAQPMEHRKVNKGHPSNIHVLGHVEEAHALLHRYGL